MWAEKREVFETGEAQVTSEVNSLIGIKLTCMLLDFLCTTSSKIVKKLALA